MPASCGDGSIIDTRVKSPRSFGVTFVHLPPLSRVIWMNPSSDPVQMVPFSFGDSAMVKIVPYVSTPVWSFVIGPPDGPSVAGSCRVRSGLIAFHDIP